MAKALNITLILLTIAAVIVAGIVIMLHLKKKSPVAITAALPYGAVPSAKADISHTFGNQNVGSPTAAMQPMGAQPVASAFKNDLKGVFKNLTIPGISKNSVQSNFINNIAAVFDPGNLFTPNAPFVFYGLYSLISNMPDTYIGKQPLQQRMKALAGDTPASKLFSAGPLDQDPLAIALWKEAANYFLAMTNTNISSMKNLGRKAAYQDKFNALLKTATGEYNHGNFAGAVLDLWNETKQQLINESIEMIQLQLYTDGYPDRKSLVAAGKLPDPLQNTWEWVKFLITQDPMPNTEVQVSNGSDSNGPYLNWYGNNYYKKKTDTERHIELKNFVDHWQHMKNYKPPSDIGAIMNGLSVILSFATGGPVSAAVTESKYVTS